MLLSQEEYQIYLKYVPDGIEPIAREELEKVRFIAADNTIGRSLMTWSRKALESIATRLVGMPFTVDHDWYNVTRSIGIIFAAEVVEAASIPKSMIDNYAFSDNKSIIAKNGWTPVVMSVAIPKSNSEVIEQLATGSASKVSIGGFKVTEIWCPLCNCSFHNRGICSHVPPSPWYSNGENTAPYTIRQDTVDMGECSLVLIPNSPSATIVTASLAKLIDR